MSEVIIFILGGASFFLLDIVKTYIKAKITNEANIEDLPLITKISENIKQKYNEDLSNINAQLAILTKQSNLVDEKSVQVLNVFFERCLEIRDLHSQNYGDLISDDISKTLIDYQTKVETAHRKLYSDYHNLILFHSKNKKIIKNANEIISSAHIVKITFKKHFGKIKIAVIRENQSMHTPEYDEAVDFANKIIKDYNYDKKSGFLLFEKCFNNLLNSFSIYFSEYGLNYDYKNLRQE